MEGQSVRHPSYEVYAGERAKEDPVTAAEDEGELNTSRGSPILNTPLGLKNRNKARRKNQQMSKCTEDSVARLQIVCNSSNPGEKELQTDFIIPKTPVQKGALQASQICCESDSEDMFASDTSEGGDENIPSNLQALFNGPESSNLSWTSSMATPVAGNVTWSNLNTEERQVLLPSEDCDTFRVKPRALFTPDLNDTADCHSLNMSSDVESLMTHRKDISLTPKLLQRKNSTGHKVFIESPLVTNAAPNSTLTSPCQVGELVEKITPGSPILSGSSEYKRTPAQFKEMFPEEEDLFENVEPPYGITSCNQTTKGRKKCGPAESTPNPESRRRSPPHKDTDDKSVKSDQGKEVIGNSSEIALRAQKREYSEVSTPGKHPDTKRRRLLFSTYDTVLNSPKSVFKVPAAKPTVEAIPHSTENPADELIPDDSFSEHLATMSTSIFADPIAPISKVQAIKSSASHMKKFSYTLGEEKSVPDDIKDYSPSKSQPLMEEIIKSVLAQETSKEVASKGKSVAPSGDLIVFSHLLSKEECQIENKLETTVATQIALNLNNVKAAIDLQTDGFQTANGHSIEISQEALQKGLHCFKSAMEDVDIESLKMSSNVPCSSGGSLAVLKSSCVEIDSKTSKDDEILQAEEEVKQLLQLVKSGEDFDPWHENEQPLQAKHEQPMHGTSAGKSGLDFEAKSCDLEEGALGFATASGRNISISEINLAKAKRLFESDNELVDLIRGEDIESSRTPHAKTIGDKSAGNHNVLYENVKRTQPEPDAEDRSSKPQDQNGLGVITNHDGSHLENSRLKSSFMKCEDPSASSISDSEVADEMKISNEALSFLTSLMDNSKQESFSIAKCEKTDVLSGAKDKTMNASEEASTEVGHAISDYTGNGNTAGKAMEQKSLRHNVDSLSKSETTSFTTASGRSVSVSRQSLKKMKTVFDDLADEYHSIPDVKDVARESLMKEKGVLDDQSSTEASKQGSSGMFMVQNDFVSGFSTASGKFVSIAKEALNKAKKIFDAIPSEDETPSVKAETFHCRKGLDLMENRKFGFSTANGKAVSVSKDAIQKVKGLFDAEVTSLDLQTLLSIESSETVRADATIVKSSFSDSGGQSIPMAGFATAGGKNVHISKQALNKARQILDDLNSESQIVLPESLKLEKSQVTSGQSNLKKTSRSSNISLKMDGFSTAGGQDVLISKEALSKVKHLFDDIESDSSLILPENTILEKSEIVNEQSCFSSSTVSSNLAVKMPGFSTAGGKEVHISKEALSKAKTLFMDDPGEDNNALTASNVNRTEDDSGVFLSHENTPFELSVNKSSNLVRTTCKKLPNTPNFSNKENWGVSQSGLVKTDSVDGHKESLTQEISESTAALLADEADLEANSVQTICTSPSMATDRCSNFKPFLTSGSGSKLEVDGPTSPILMKNDSRRRPRRGRLSLSGISSKGSLSPTLASQSTLSQNSQQKSRLSLLVPQLSSGFPSPTCSGAISKGSKNHSPPDSGELSKMASAQPAPLRKLFVDDIAPLFSTKGLAGNSEAKDKPIVQGIPEPSISPKTEAQNVAKSSSSVPLVKRVLNRNLSAQSSGFKTPYKQASKERQKRTPPSPLPNPSESKRRRSSTNLYASHINVSSSEQANFGTRIIRCEVEEMRRRAAEEQKQLAENYNELKGDLLEPCIGSWLSTKTCNGNPKVKLAQLGLPGRFLRNDLIKSGLRPSTLTITSENASDFRFSAWDYYSEDMCRENVAGLPVGDGAFLVLDSAGTAGVDEVERSFLASPGVDPSLVPPGWIKNHYRWLVWKLAAYEWRFPYKFGQRCLSPHLLMLQLKYRYDREIDHCERPALRRIFEHDDSAGKRMVLCVASIIKPKDDNQSGSGLELELTDGWYSVIASIDQDMQHRVRKGIIDIGTKLVTHGAELINCTDGCFPLQARPEVRLKICSNSTRRSQWYTKLGYQDNPGPIRIVLSSILSSGGLISCVTAYIARVYPIIFMQKTGERTVVRSQRAELKEVAKCEKKKQQEAELVYNKIQLDVEKEQSKRRRSSVKLSLKYVSTLTSGEELVDLLENSSDPISVQNMLTEDQKNIVSDYQRRKQEEFCQEVEDKVRLHLLENSQHDRHITPILKIRLVDSARDKLSNCALLSVYRPSEDVSSIFMEGHKLSIFGAVASGLRCGELQLSANRSTRYIEESSADIMPGLARSITPLRSLLSHGFLPRFGELDIAGIILSVSPAPRTSENSTHFQTVYVSDSQLNIVGISFREGVKEFGVEDLLIPHSPIVASNLQWRGGPVVRALPCVFASELSAFTSNPRQKHHQTALQELRSSLPSDLKSFCHRAAEHLDVLLKQKVSMSGRTPDPPTSVLQQEDISSRNQNCSLQNLSTLNSPIVVKAQQNLSMEQQFLTTASSNCLSPAVEKKIAKLGVYGEPPPISPIIMSQPRRLRKSFKAPRRTDSPIVDSKKT